MFPTGFVDRTQKENKLTLRLYRCLSEVPNASVRCTSFKQLHVSVLNSPQDLMLVHQSLKLQRQIKVLEVAIPVAMPGLSRMLTFYNHFFPIVAGYLKTKYMYRGDFILLDYVSRFHTQSYSVIRRR